MFWAGVIRVGDDGDILEASIRHNLARLDRLVAIDDDASDEASVVLEGLVAEGLALERVRGATGADPAAGHATRLLADGADLCVTIAADAFLQVPSRPAFDAFVAAANPSATPMLARFSCSIGRDPGIGIVERLRHARRVPGEPGLPRVPVMRRATRGDAGDARIDVPAAIAGIDVVPVRDSEQATARALSAACARLLGSSAPNGNDAAWQRLCADLLAGRSLDDARLDALVDELAAAGAAPAWQDHAVTGPLVLRHTPAGSRRALARVLRYGERLAVELRSATGGL